MPLSQEVRGKVLELHSQGVSQQEISAQLGISQPSVSRIVSGRKGRAPSGPPKNPKNWEGISFDWDALRGVPSEDPPSPRRDDPPDVDDETETIIAQILEMERRFPECVAGDPSTQAALERKSAKTLRTLLRGRLARIGINLGGVVEAAALRGALTVVEAVAARGGIELRAPYSLQDTVLNNPAVDKALKQLSILHGVTAFTSPWAALGAAVLQGAISVGRANAKTNASNAAPRREVPLSTPQAAAAPAPPAAAELGQQQDAPVLENLADEPDSDQVPRDSGQDRDQQAEADQAELEERGRLARERLAALM